MGLKNFVVLHTPHFIKLAYNNINKFHYRTIGTLYKKYNSSAISSNEFFKLTGYRSISELSSYFKERKSPIFFTPPANKFILKKLIKKISPYSIKSTINSAEKILNHTFDLLGSSEVNLGQKINWHLDFIVNHRWPLGHPKGININELNKSSDIKVPWELSRFQHLITLGKAYWYTKDEKYPKEFKKQINSWIKDNPFGLGINWLCTMDVAIRACNWILGWYFFKSSSLIDEKFAFDFVKSLFQHGRHILKNLENKGEVTSNHYLADITGLFYLGVFFQNTEEGKKWKIFGISELISEMQKQVNPDGMDFEGSTCYHRLVLELFFFPTVLSVINDEAFNEDYMETAKKIFGEQYIIRLYKMFEFVLYTLKPSGKMPQIGDNDNGRLYIFSDKDKLDMKYLLNYGAIFFNEPKFKIKEFGLREDMLWLFGKDGHEKWKKLPENSISTIKSKAFPDSEIYVMRDKEQFIIISCMHNGQNGNGGHNHNDVFSFELNIDGRDFIIDPGTYSYTGDYKMRNYFRSSLSHNIVVMDGQEINRFKEKEVFRMENEAKPRVLRWETDNNYDLLEAEHYGYMKLPNLIIHRRKFFFDKKKCLIKIYDFFEGEGIHTYKIFFHFPSIPLCLKNAILKTNFSKGANISIKSEPEEVNAELRVGWISPSYGIKSEAPYLIYSVKEKTPFIFTTIISFQK